jgi:hypothetical protein
MVEFPLLFDERSDILFRNGQAWNRAGRCWQPVDEVPAGLQTIDPAEAVRHLHAPGSGPRVPVGVIGPRQARQDQLGLAEELGESIARLGLVLLCGGRQGVMEAVCRGARSAGGLTIGILPDDDWTLANRYVDIPIATGLGPARNAVVARACAALVAVGGGYGTLSEMAFGMQFARPVIALGDAPEVAGARKAATVKEAVELLSLALLRLPPFADDGDG